MARRDAVAAVDLVFRKLNRRSPPSRSHVIPLAGGDIGEYQAFLQAAEADTLLPPSSLRCLVNTLGSEYTQVMRLVRNDGALSVMLGNSPVIKAPLTWIPRSLINCVA